MPVSGNGLGNSSGNGLGNAQQGGSGSGGLEGTLIEELRECLG